MAGSKAPTRIKLDGETPAQPIEGEPQKRSAEERAAEDAQMENIGSAGHVNTKYGAAQIEVLEGLEAVRRNVPMYIGGTDANGLHHLFTEVSDNSVDEAL